MQNADEYCFIYDKDSGVTYPGFASRDEANAQIKEWRSEDNVVVHCCPHGDGGECVHSFYVDMKQQ